MEQVQAKSDILGTIASGLCAVHCAATPLLFVVQSCTVSGCCENSPAWWSAIDYFFIGISGLAVYWSATNTSRTWMKYALVTSWFALTLFILNEKLDLLPIAEAFKYSGALLLIGLHLFNMRYRQCNQTECYANN